MKTFLISRLHWFGLVLIHFRRLATHIAIFDLAGHTCFLLITDPTEVDACYPCSINASDKFATYPTTGVGFPVPGTHQVQLEYRNSGELHYSTVQSVKGALVKFTTTPC